MLLAHDERLSLDDLQRERLLEGTRCFSASGCVTGLGDLETAPDELGSFAAGVLQAGSPSAVATLWPVDDRATFLLMRRFHYELLRDTDVTLAEALREATHWLRSASASDLKAFAKMGLTGANPTQDPPAAVAFETEPATVRGIFGDDDEADGLRLTTADALRHLSRMLQSSDAEKPPYAHPIYWACAMVYGA